MKFAIKICAIGIFTVLGLTACREATETEPTAEDKVEEMVDNADEVKIKDDKIKLENADGSETKIKYDENGNIEKIKTDD